MKNGDYPGLFQRADRASVKAQRAYLRFECGRLWLLIGGSLFPVLYALVGDCGRSTLDAVVVIVLFLIVVISLVAKGRRDDEAWFDCRAIAETTKGATWRYMMKMSPFQNDRSEISFVARLKEIREARLSEARDLATESSTEQSPITNFMRQARSQRFEERKCFYIEERLKDQKYWYSRKAKLNSRCDRRSFWVFMGMQMVAICTAVGKLAYGWEISMVPVLMTGAAALIAWGETKRYRELAQSYALASQELEEQEAIAESIADEVEFLKFIDMAEEEISREHTMWRVKRDREIPR